MPLVDLLIPESIGEVDECVVVTWLKREGDHVEPDETILELQAAKVTFDVPSPVTGRLIKILVNQGDVVNQKQVLAHLEVTETGPTIAEKSLPPEETVERKNYSVSPLAAKKAADKGVDLSLVKGSGPNGRITRMDVDAFVVAQEKQVPKEVLSSPAARRLAREHKIDLDRVIGTGSDGRITEHDVQSFLDRQTANNKPIPTKKATEDRPIEIPVAGARAIIAQRMLQSSQTTAQLTLHTEVDLTEIVSRHAADKERAGITYTDYIVRACAQALRQHPNINARLDGSIIRLLSQINIGLAVSLDDGLIVPVIVNADQLPLEEIAQSRIRLVERARKGLLIPSEYSGGTFTVTNLGTYDIDGFTPILNPPELAILGVGRIVEKVTVHQGRIAQRSMMTLSLTIDHQIIDGAPGAAFLNTIKLLLENTNKIK